MTPLNKTSCVMNRTDITDIALYLIIAFYLLSLALATWWLFSADEFLITPP
jgi:hypothetical protein